MAPRFSFVQTLAVCLEEPQARRLFEAALGLEEVEAAREDAQLAFRSGRGVVFVDARGAKNAPVGFIPLFVTDDLTEARAHLTAHGCAVDPVPWAPDAPSVLVRAPGGVTFCVGDRAFAGHEEREAHEEGPSG